MTKSNGWAPLSYPSSSIFELIDSRRAVSGGGIADTASGNKSATPQKNKSWRRHPNPYFPLHKHVLVAALKELLLIDGTMIDVRSLRLIDRDDCDVVADVKTGHCAQKEAKDSTVDIVPPDGKMKIDFSRFTCAEDLIEFMLEQVIHSGGENDQTQRSDCREKEISMCESTYIAYGSVDEKEMVAVASKRKVSDVDEDEHCEKKPRLGCRSFPPHLVQLVRSNVVVLQKNRHAASSQDRPAANNSPMQSFQSCVSTISDEDIQEFLQCPQIVMQKQHPNKPIMALPRLLQTNIVNESHLRSKSYQLSSSLLNSYYELLHAPLQIFLGYKSSKTKSIDKSKLISIFANVLFDVSHAFYAWIQTEAELQCKETTMSLNGGKKGNRVCIPTQSHNNDDNIKNSLFDERALKRIGGFHPSSLLPLSLGIRYCHVNRISWEEYAMTKEGKKALEIHCCAGALNGKRNEMLLEIGKWRRGRRGRGFRDGGGAASFVVG